MERKLLAGGRGRPGRGLRVRSCVLGSNPGVLCKEWALTWRWWADSDLASGLRRGRPGMLLGLVPVAGGVLEVLVVVVLVG